MLLAERCMLIFINLYHFLKDIFNAAVCRWLAFSAYLIVYSLLCVLVYGFYTLFVFFCVVTYLGCPLGRKSGSKLNE